ncbi:hypothetical protein, partial [Glaciimonas sp. Cout2]|uniref:hypothetical protein n=1 Tax=Glaciimonas sp. Cout2 TaxID=3048621 RepID=UPI002B222AE2
VYEQFFQQPPGTYSTERRFRGARASPLPCHQLAQSDPAHFADVRRGVGPLRTALNPALDSDADRPQPSAVDERAGSGTGA